MKSYSIDLETLGTNTLDTVLSVGICEFNKENGNILKTLQINFSIPENKTIPCTLATIKFWMEQASHNLDAVMDSFYSKETYSYKEGLIKLSNFIDKKDEHEIWANGTKFDIGMLENLFTKYSLRVPWKYNSDRCMRTLKMFCGKLEIDSKDYKFVPHSALSDAIWQAKYISKALSLIYVSEENN